MWERVIRAFIVCIIKYIEVYMRPAAGKRGYFCICASNVKIQMILLMALSHQNVLGQRVSSALKIVDTLANAELSQKKSSGTMISACP